MPHDEDTSPGRRSSMWPANLPTRVRNLEDKLDALSRAIVVLYFVLAAAVVAIAHLLLRAKGVTP